MKRTLFLIELPPPIHGMTYINKIIFDKYKNDERAIFLILNFTNKVSDISKFSFVKIFKNLKIIVKTWWFSIFSKTSQVYFLLSMTKFGIIRDFFILLPSLILRKKIFIHLHGSSIINIYNQNILYRILLKVIVFSNSKFIALSNQHLLNLSNEIPLLKKKIFFINNTIVNRVNIKEIKTKKPDYNFLFLSNIHTKKGILELIDAMSDFKNATLFIAGEYFDINEEILNTKIKNTVDPSKIIYYGFADEKLKHELFSKSDIFILPSKFDEGSPISIIEALSYGLPIVSTDVGSIPEMIEGCGISICKNYDVNMLVNAINFVIDNIDKFSCNSYSKYLNNYTNEKFFKCFEHEILSYYEN